MNRQTAWRLWLVVVVTVVFFAGALSRHFISLGRLDWYGGMTSVLSSIAWALSTSFDSDELASGFNIIAAALAAMTTGIFYLPDRASNQQTLVVDADPVFCCDYGGRNTKGYHGTFLFYGIVY